MVLLTRDNLLKKQSLRIERVDLSQKEYVFVREMTGRERDMFEQSLLQEVTDTHGNLLDYRRSLEDFRAKLAVQTLCDADGKNLLKPSDYKILSRNMSASRLEKIVTVAQKLNAVTEEYKEDMVKNSGGGQSGDSISD